MPSTTAAAAAVHHHPLLLHNTTNSSHGNNTTTSSTSDDHHACYSQRRSSTTATAAAAAATTTTGPAPPPPLLAHAQPRVPPAAPSPPKPHARSPSARHSASPPQQQSPSPSPQQQTRTMSRSANQWLFTAAELAATPSMAAGLSGAEERARRAKGVNFIVQAGMLLRVPQVTLGSAAVFFHRFYMRVGMVGERGVHHYNIAATALFLATKAEENCRKTKEIVIAVAKVAQKNASLIVDEQSKEFWRWKDSILLYEETMLELLTFDVVLESPYTHLHHHLLTLGLADDRELRNMAWAFLNDSQMTTLSLRMEARDVAVVAVYFGARWTRARVRDVAGEAWWARLGGSEARIAEAVEVMREFYAENPLGKVDRAHEGSPGLELEATREGSVGGGEEGGAREGSEGAGDDDALLKRVANDPATHERVGEVARGGEGGDAAAVAAARKREAEGAGGVDGRGMPHDGEREAKRARLEEAREEGEQSEEGEVEE